MMRGALVTLTDRPPLDPFLQAEIGETVNGMPISVRSALARQGMDPAEAAASLAGMPAEVARRTLAGVIDKVQDGGCDGAECRRRACRVLALLPHGAADGDPRQPALRRAWAWMLRRPDRGPDRG